MTDAERRQALETIAAEVRSCTDCRLHEGRTRAVPGEGDPDTEVVFVGEGPGFNEDRLGRPFVGRAGDLLVKLLASIGWRREEVFITNVVKCRPPDNRDPQPDEIAACAKYLHRQLEILDPAVVVTLGRHSMARFMPGARISQAHGTVRAADPSTGARSATVFAMYHPAAALRTPSIERESFADMAGVPAALIDARRRRDAAPTVTPAPGTEIPASPPGPTQPMGAADLAVPSALEPGVATEPPTVPAEPPALEPSVIEPRPAAPQAPPAPAATEDATPQLTLF
ncbi:MAG TPA: uracil-DNA glycosylase family protein [Candidatus Limnocylindrales bacterium]